MAVSYSLTAVATTAATLLIPKSARVLTNDTYVTGTANQELMFTEGVTGWDKRPLAFASGDRCGGFSRNPYTSTFRAAS